MSTIRVGINGFGRIGRVMFRFLQDKPNVEVVAINDLTDEKTLAHLLKYDSIHGGFQGEVLGDAGLLRVNGKDIVVTSERDPKQIPWGNAQVDVVVESTGLFRTMELAGAHLRDGVRKVIISAPASGSDVKSVVLGVNDHILDGSEGVVSNASCTTNCAAPMVKVIDALCGIKEGFITTVHSYTSDQRLHDAPHKDLRRARSAAQNIVPTSTGAAKAIGIIFPHLSGALQGAAYRVPVIDGSITDITVRVANPKSADEIRAAFKAAAEEGSLKGILKYNEDPIVSSDIIGSPYSCIYDADLTEVSGDLVKIVGWYDNEAGYSSRLADLIERIG